MSGSATADAALAASSQTNADMYRLVYDAVKFSPDGLTTDEIAECLGKNNHLVSARVAYLTLYGYLRYSKRTRTTRNGSRAEVLEVTGKPADKFVCPLRETQKDFLHRIAAMVLNLRFEDDQASSQRDEIVQEIYARHDSLRR